MYEILYYFYWSAAFPVCMHPNMNRLDAYMRNVFHLTHSRLKCEIKLSSIEVRRIDWYHQKMISLLIMNYLQRAESTAGGGPGYAPRQRRNDVVVARPPLSLTSRALDSDFSRQLYFRYLNYVSKSPTTLKIYNICNIRSSMLLMNIETQF